MIIGCVGIGNTTSVLLSSITISIDGQEGGATGDRKIRESVRPMS